MRLRLFALLIVAVIALCGCGRRKRSAARAPAPGPAATVGATQEGIASWYGYPYHGRRSANGEVYDMEKLTAAHRELPFETWVKVQNLDNSKVVEVRITDRGPFVEGRVIDLSKAAAREIDLLRSGTAPVRLTVVRLAGEGGQGFYAVQAGAFREKENAEELRVKLEKQFGRAEIKLSGEPELWRVLVGREPTLEAARKLASRVRSETGSAFVLRLDSN